MHQHWYRLSCATYCYSVLQVLQHNLDDPREREIMRDDSRKWALLFLAIGGGTAIGFILQVGIKWCTIVNFQL